MANERAIPSMQWKDKRTVKCSETPIPFFMLIEAIAIFTKSLEIAKLRKI